MIWERVGGQSKACCPPPLSKPLKAYTVTTGVGTLKQNVRFGTNRICHRELDSFPMLKEFSDEINDDINKSNSFLYHIMKGVTI